MDAPFSLTINVVEYGTYDPGLPLENKTDRFMRVKTSISDRSIVFSKSEVITSLADEILQEELSKDGVNRANFFISGRVFIAQFETDDAISETWYEDNHSIGSNLLNEAKAGKPSKEFLETFWEKTVPLLKAGISGIISKNRQEAP